MSRQSEDSDYANFQRVHLHAGWLQYKSSQKEWASAWAVLKNNIIFLFQSEITSLENHMGTLRLEQNCSVHFKDDKKHACRFEVHSPSKKNIFKVKTPYEREQWRAYLTGLLTGSVSEDVVLSPPELKEIQKKVNQSQQHAVSSPLPPIPPTQGGNNNQQPSQKATSICRHSESIISKCSDSSGSIGSASEISRSSLSFGDSCDSLVLSSGGPFMRHKFYTDGKTDTPSWFFSKCSPELAEKILKNNPEQGNTLMRLSSRDLISGTYAISKCMKRTGEVLHYEVIRVAEGYKIKVQNEHDPMKCLSEVMSFFQKMSGEATTFPMKTNNLQELGISEPHYADFIRPPSVCQLIRNGSNARSSFESESLYEEPVTVKNSLSRSGVDLSASRLSSPVAVKGNPSRSSTELSAQFPPPPPQLVLTSEMERLSFTQGNKTWSSRKNELTSAGPDMPRTLSGAKQSRACELRPLSDIQQQIQIENVVKDFDEQLDKAISGNLPPPPLPEVPKDRPKLYGNQPLYANESPASRGGAGNHRRESEPEAISNGPANPHPRYSHRSLSIPSVPLPSSNLDFRVPAGVKAPSMVSPEPVTLNASASTNSLHAGQVLQKGLSLDEGQGGPIQPALSMFPNNGVQEELRKKLEARKRKSEARPDSVNPDNDQIYANLD